MDNNALTYKRAAVYMYRSIESKLDLNVTMTSRGDSPVKHSSPALESGSVPYPVAQRQIPPSHTELSTARLQSLSLRQSRDPMMRMLHTCSDVTTSGDVLSRQGMG